MTKDLSGYESPESPNIMPLRFTPRSLLEELMSDGSIALVVNYPWLRKSFVEDGHRLVRRQDLPDVALVATEDAAAAVSVMGGAGVISHGWLAPGHPDPEGRRRLDIAEITNGILFWDFLSLFQVPRCPHEEEHFHAALRNMHLVYGHHLWFVYRLLTPDGSHRNATLYLARGWCYFESGVATLGTNRLHTIMNGKRMRLLKSPVPLTPERFSQEVKNLHFTSTHTDVDVVCELYRRIFPELAADEDLRVCCWTDKEVEELLETLPSLTGLKNVEIDQYGDAEISKAMEVALDTVLRSRGGQLHVTYM
jgi:hypothetical protein